MKANKAGQQALIAILNNIYTEIRVIEERLGLRLDGNDFRPRIEYFHDAIRTLSSGAAGDKRLSVEYLAYDVAMLRKIQASPLARSQESKNLSTSTDVVALGKAAAAGFASSSEKSQLAELYKNYSVLFVALLTEAADRDYQSKVDQCNQEVESVAVVEKIAKKTAAGKDSNINLEELIHQHVDDPTLIRKILNQFGSKKNKIAASEASGKLSEMMKASDKFLKSVEQAHFNFCTSQLAIYENAKDVVKGMAMKGLNIVGSFVENAVREATRSAGRGL